MKSRILLKLPVVYYGQSANLCDKDCPHLRLSKGDNSYFCRFFGKLTESGNVIMRDEECIKAEDADYHFDMLIQKIT